MKNWNDITLKQFNEIKNLLAQPDENLTCNLLDVIYTYRGKRTILIRRQLK